MIIDIHNHPYWYSYSPEKFVANMDENGIDITCLLTWESPDDEYEQKYNNVLPDVGKSGGPVSFDSCLKCRDYAPDRFLLGYAPDPRRPDAIDKLLFAKKTYDIKMCGEIKLRMMLDNCDAIRMYRVCAEHQLPVLVHLDYEWDVGVAYPRPNYWYGGGIEALERALKKCPDTVFIGHAPGFWAHISNDKQALEVPYPKGKVTDGGEIVRLLENYDNLYCDISAGSGCGALSRDPEYTVGFLNKFRSRVLFGRDYFDNQHRTLLDSLKLDKGVLEDIYCNNAKRLLKI